MNTTSETTTDLDVIRKHGHRFTWGYVTEIYDIGPYTIAKYRDNNGENIRFHVYVDGKCTSNSCHTLEGALLLAMARKHLEVNEARYMAMGACKLLGIKEGT